MDLSLLFYVDPKKLNINCVVQNCGLRSLSTAWCCFKHLRLLTYSFPLSLNYSQEVTQKILEAVGNIAGSSLEQTSWLSRNLEVKAQPQISLEESDAEEDLCGRCGRIKK